MTKKELIDLLADYPDDIRIVIPGYEGGLNDISNIKVTKIVLNCNTVWYYGKHEEVEYFHRETTPEEKDDAILIS